MILNDVVSYTSYILQVLHNNRYNIKLIHQVPRSPYTHILDIGIWCAIQAAVDKEHFMK